MNLKPKLRLTQPSCLDEPADITQVVGQLLNLPDVGRSLDTGQFPDE